MVKEEINKIMSTWEIIGVVYFSLLALVWVTEAEKWKSRIIIAMIAIIMIPGVFYYGREKNTIGGSLYKPPPYHELIEKIRISNYLDRSEDYPPLYLEQRAKWYKIINTYYKDKFEEEDPDVSGDSFKRMLDKAIEESAEQMKDIFDKYKKEIRHENKT